MPPTAWLLPFPLPSSTKPTRLVSSPPASAPQRHATPRAPPARPPPSPKSLSPAGPRSHARAGATPIPNRSRRPRP
ncbi:hypothetical protein GQ55_6G022700 [Panicum hallii var. hallii]|uniref:Uncharacterized protein n=1 Tax=Panicum hallii var. hallii TaxID=1504633 RepID=A0A2T7D320_9POAL|nr:hypothetical protein GQ55_6G022700 [Panicum hallii var. hallii]